MIKRRFIPTLLSFGLFLMIVCGAIQADEKPTQVTVDWAKVVRVSKTTPTLQVVVNPPLRRGATIHDSYFRALHELGCDVVRYVPWLALPQAGRR